MTVPTIGRKVYFKPDPVNQPDLIYDATVCAVHGQGGYVNLAINDSLGHPFSAQSVVFVQPGDPVPALPYAHWMPYQVRQHEVIAQDAAIAAEYAALAAPRPPITDADAAADLAGTPRPDNPSPGPSAADLATFALPFAGFDELGEPATALATTTA